MAENDNRYNRNESNESNSNENGTDNNNSTSERGRFDEATNIFWPSPKFSPWAHPEKRPGLPGKTAVGAMAFLFLSLLLPIYDLHEACFLLQIAALVGIGLFLCLHAGSIGTMLLLLIPCSILVVCTLSPLSAAAFMALIGGCVLTAYLFSHKRAWMILPPVLGAGVLVFLFTGNLYLTASVLVPVTAGLALGYATMSYKHRIASICLTSGVLATVALFIFAFFLKNEIGNADESLFETARRLIEAGRETMIGWLTDAGATFEETFSVAPYSEDLVTLAVGVLIGLIPAVFIILCNLIAFLSQSTLIAICRHRKPNVYVTLPACQFRMSLASALVFIFCYFCSLFSHTGSSFYFVVKNLELILEPGLCLIGIGTLATRIMLSRRPPSLFFIFATAALILFMPSLLFTFMAFTGAYYLFFHALRMRLPRE